MTRGEELTASETGFAVATGRKQRPTSMAKAVVLTKYGAPDVLVWSDVPIPEPGPGQVRIRIKAAGVSPSDLKIRRGDLQAVFKLPRRAVLGFEAFPRLDVLPQVGGYVIARTIVDGTRR